MAEKERSLAKFQAKQAELAAARKQAKRQNRPATRAEQHERYIDAGPQAWDDIDASND